MGVIRVCKENIAPLRGMLQDKMIKSLATISFQDGREIIEVTTLNDGIASDDDFLIKTNGEWRVATCEEFDNAVVKLMDKYFEHLSNGALERIMKNAEIKLAWRELKAEAEAKE